MTVGYQNRNAYSAHLDLGGQADEEKTFGYRLNLLDEEGKVMSGTVKSAVSWPQLPWTGRSGREHRYSWMPVTTIL